MSTLPSQRDTTKPSILLYSVHRAQFQLYSGTGYSEVVYCVIGNKSCIALVVKHGIYLNSMLWVFFVMDPHQENHGGCSVTTVHAIIRGSHSFLRAFFQVHNDEEQLHVASYTHCIEFSFCSVVPCGLG